MTKLFSVRIHKSEIEMMQYLRKKNKNISGMFRNMIKQSYLNEISLEKK